MTTPLVKLNILIKEYIMNFEMSSIINTYKSYLAIQLSGAEIESMKAGNPITATIDFLEGATIQVQISGKNIGYPESWPKPNITSNDNAECPIPGCPSDERKL